MKMHNPPHPGEVLKALCLEPLGLTVTAAAKALGVSRKTLSSIMNRDVAIKGRPMIPRPHGSEDRVALPRTIDGCH